MFSTREDLRDLGSETTFESVTTRDRRDRGIDSGNNQTQKYEEKETKKKGLGLWKMSGMSMIDCHPLF
jgi:hypothetical protein